MAPKRRKQRTVPIRVLRQVYDDIQMRDVTGRNKYTSTTGLYLRPGGVRGIVPIAVQGVVLKRDTPPELGANWVQKVHGRR